MAKRLEANFDADTLNSAPAGWVRASGNFSVTTVNPISGSQGIRETAAALLTALIYTAGTTIDDGKITGFYKVTKTSGAASISLICRANAAFTSGYFWNITENGNGQLFRRSGSGSSYAQVGGVIGNAFGVNNAVGDTIGIELSFVGSAIEFRRWNITQGQTRPDTTPYKHTDTTLTSGFCGILNNTDGSNANDNPTADNITIEDTSATVAATSYTFTGPTSSTVGIASGNCQVMMNGTLAQDRTFTPSDNGGGGTFTPATITIPAGQQSGNCSYTAGSTGAKSISATNNASLPNPAAFTLTVNAGPVVISRNNAAIYYSPNSWCDDGTSKITPYTGAYIKIATNGSTTLKFTCPALGPIVTFPRMIAVVDGVEKPFSLTTATSYIIDLGTAGAHTIEIHMEASLFSVAGGTGWWDGTNAWKISGFELEAGGTFLTPAIRPLIYLAYGDSITQGYYVFGRNSPVSDSARATYVSAIAAKLNAEYGQIGIGGSNWNQAGVGGFPGFNSSYDKVMSGFSRLTNGLFTIQPDIISTCFGTNGNEAQSYVATGLGLLRAAAPNAFIFAIIPPGGFMRAETKAAVLARGDARIKAIDGGLALQEGLENPAGAENQWSVDRQHCKTRKYLFATAAWTPEMLLALISTYTLRVA